MARIFGDDLGEHDIGRAVLERGGVDLEAEAPVCRPEGPHMPPPLGGGARMQIAGVGQLDHRTRHGNGLHGTDGAGDGRLGAFMTQSPGMISFS